MNNTDSINHYGLFTLMSSHAEMTSFSMLVIQNIRTFYRLTISVTQFERLF